MCVCVCVSVREREGCLSCESKVYLVEIFREFLGIFVVKIRILFRWWGRVYLSCEFEVLYVEIFREVGGFDV